MNRDLPNSEPADCTRTESAQPQSAVCILTFNFENYVENAAPLVEHNGT